VSDPQHGKIASWWRRPRQLHRLLAGALAFVALVSVALAGILNYTTARTLLDGATEAKLATIAGARSETIETGLADFLGRVASEAGDRGTVEAFSELNSGLG
jgi:hypothetical protein